MDSLNHRMKEKNECLIKYKEEIRALQAIQKKQVSQIAEIEKEVVSHRL